MSNETINKLNILLNDYVVKDQQYGSLIFSNTKLIYLLTLFIISNYDQIPNEINYDLDYATITPSGLFNNIEIVKKYYQQQNIDFDIDEAITKGVINFKEYDLFNYNNDNLQTKFDSFSYGVVKNNHEHKILDICNNGLITDSALLVHELSHLRDDLINNEVGDFYTELLAVAEELIFINYLADQGYKKEAILLKKDYCLRSKILANNSRVLFKMLDLYQELGSISIESYHLYYKNSNDYDQEINILQEIFAEHNENVSKRARYILAYALSPYLCDEYLHNPDNMNKIKNFHQKISRGEEDIFQILISSENIMKVKIALQNMQQTILDDERINKKI